ncbi:MAG TPA: NAD(P)-dependent oxidoreductase [Gammaproteobacteria bacterium]|nr:NAD(P)-dependent oxidoreductase [Gammaproteobacteria bacterium]
MKTGFIGLGAMGMPMARNLHKAGLLAAVYNRSPDKARALAAELGCIAAASVAELAKLCEAVVLCVSADADVLEMVEALAPALAGGALVVDCSTVGAATARKAGKILGARGIDFLDCPVSGGTEGARHGTLAIMCGGTEAAFQRAQPLLNAMGKRVALMGPAGAGQATKAVNQIVVAGVAQAVSEALAFADAQGLPLEKVIEVVGSGAAQSWFLTNRGPNMMRMTFPLGFKVSLHDKDLDIVQRMAAAQGVQLPVVEMTRIHYRRLMADGHGDEDISSLFRLKHALFKK